MKIRDVMVSDIETAEPDDTLDEVAIMMRDQDTGAIPVVEDGELIGIVTDRDIVLRCVAEGKDPTETAADEVITGDLHIIEPDADLEDARKLMAKHQIRRLPVVENGQLVGMVSLGDLAVKADEDKVADTLEDISEGVKASDQSPARSSGRKQSQPARKAQPAASIQRRDRTGEDDRGDVDRVQKTQGQGITSHSADEEVERQNRIVPIRTQQKTNVRGDRSKSSSKRKTG